MLPNPWWTKIPAFKAKIGSKTAPHWIILEPEAIREIRWSLRTRLKVLECTKTQGWPTAPSGGDIHSYTSFWASHRVSIKDGWKEHAVLWAFKSSLKLGSCSQGYSPGKSLLVRLTTSEHEYTRKATLTGTSIFPGMSFSYNPIFCRWWKLRLHAKVAHPTTTATT